MTNGKIVPAGSSFPGAVVRDATAPAANHPLMLTVLLTGQVMAAMDTSIVNVAAPALRHDLQMSDALLQMVVAGYVLAYAVLLILGARLGADYGYRRIFMVGAALFTVMSLASGLAPEPISLVVARVLQGIGAALMVPQVLSLIQLRFDGAARARAVGVYSMILALAVAIGQLLGGLIVSLDILGTSWRPVFLINVPIGLILLLCSRTTLPDLKGAGKVALDWLGAAMLSLSMLLVVVPLTFGREAGWAAWTWITLVLGLAGLFAFAHVERAEARRGVPLVNPAAFSSPGVTAGLLVVFICFMDYGGKLFSMALYLQSGLGFSALASGLVFAAMALGFGSASRTWAKLPERAIRWAPSAALFCYIITEAAFGALAFTRGWTPLAMIPLLTVAGACLGLSFGPVVNQMSRRIQPQFAPTLSGLVTTATQLAIVVGVATLGTLYLSEINSVGFADPSRAIAGVLFAIAASAVVSLVFALRLATQPVPAAER
jgi:MFS family permease